MSAYSDLYNKYTRLDQTSVVNLYRLLGYSGVPAVWQKVRATFSIDLDFTISDVQQITLPIGIRGQIREVGVVINKEATDVTVAPTVSFGICGDNDKYLAPTLMSNCVDLYYDDLFTNLLDHKGERTLTVEITTPATATALKGFAYFDILMYPE